MWLWTGDQGGATQALTFVYAFPPLSSCRENRKAVMNPEIQLHITQGTNYTAPTGDFKLQAETTLMVSVQLSEQTGGWHRGGIHMGEVASSLHWNIQHTCRFKLDYEQVKIAFMTSKLCMLTTVWIQNSVRHIDCDTAILLLLQKNSLQ